MEDMNMADMINQPPHYLACRPQVEPIDLTESLSFNLGNAIKYISRAGKKDGSSFEQDLRKAVYYLRREIDYLSSLSYEESSSDPISARGLSYLYWLCAIHPYLESIFLVYKMADENKLDYSIEGLRSLIERLEHTLNNLLEEDGNE